jgi:hypothetical protein
MNNNNQTLIAATVLTALLVSCAIKPNQSPPSTNRAVPRLQPLGNLFTISVKPTVSVGSIPGCPGSYAGFAKYTKSVGWGWAPSTNTSVHTATDNNRSDTKVFYTGLSGDTNCALTTVTVPDPHPSTVYRFTVYFPNNVPTTNYPLTLSGFDP